MDPLHCPEQSRVAVLFCNNLGRASVDVQSVFVHPPDFDRLTEVLDNAEIIDFARGVCLLSGAEQLVERYRRYTGRVRRTGIDDGIELLAEHHPQASAR
jgi:hypothetical protein